MQIRHTKGSQFVATHRDHEIVIDQPTDKGGFDQGMTPPEVFIASLGACIGVYVVDFCERHNISTENLTVNLFWEKAQNPPNRIGRIQASVELPVEVPQSMRHAIHRVAEQCLIHNTITHAPEILININGVAGE